MILYKYNDDSTEANVYAEDIGAGDPDEAIVAATHNGAIKEDGYYAVAHEDGFRLYTVSAENDGERYWAFRGIHRLWGTDHGSLCAGFPEPIEGYAPGSTQNPPVLPWENR